MAKRRVEDNLTIKNNIQKICRFARKLKDLEFISVK